MLPAANVGATSATRKNWPRKKRSNSRRATPELTCRRPVLARRPVEVDQRAEEQHVEELEHERARRPQVDQQLAGQDGIVAEEHGVVRTFEDAGRIRESADPALS